MGGLFERHRQLTSPGGPINRQEEDQLVNEGSSFQLLGLTGLGVGAAGVIAGVSMLALAGSPQPQISAAIIPGGAAIGVAGTLP